MPSGPSSAGRVGNSEVVLSSVPEGVPQPTDFLLQPCDEPVCPTGGIVVQTQWLALDPFQRGLISQRHHFAEPVCVGEPMRGYGLGAVLQSDCADYQPGDLLTGNGFLWQQRMAANAETCAGLAAVPAESIGNAAPPISLWLGLLGMPGLTAWAGLMHLGRPTTGDTLLVSAALGPVGSAVGQMGNIEGCRTVGIAGSADRCAMLLEEYGFDAAVNRNADDLPGQIRRACPNGVNIYFDNVGGAVLQAALANLALHARVILCGLMSQYNDAVPPPGPSLGPVIGSRSSLHGLVVYDYWSEMPDFQRHMLRWIGEGRIRWREDITEGLAAAPQAFCRLMAGRTSGRALVRL